MGAPDQLAKEVFAEEVPRLFGDKVVWQTGTELPLTEVRLDGTLLVLAPLALPPLPAPWCLLGEGVTVVEVKMPGDHLDAVALQRALLRRQAMQVAVMEAELPHDGRVALWMVAPHVPRWMRERYQPEQVAAGCWRLKLGDFEVVWVAANELPLDESLWPFLVARSGQPLVVMLRWSIGRRPLEWTDRVLETVNLAEEIRTMLKRDIRSDGQTRSPEAQQRLVANLEAMVEAWAPELQVKLAAEAVEETRRAERRAAEVGKIEAVCEVLGIALTEDRRQQLANLELVGLQERLAALKTTRGWPGD